MAGEYELEKGLFEEEKRYLMLFTPNAEAKALAETEFVLRAHSPRRSALILEKHQKASKKAAEDVRRSEERRDARKKSADPKFNFDDPDF